MSIMDPHFRCPVCGSEYFRTEGDRGYCKGNTVIMHRMYSYTGCTYSWPRADDALVFVQAKGEP